ncbi:MAG: hypothetical protein IRZ08_11920 [Frankia sp.]|nr:hypothetical protein [Frankia sp.]
MRIRPSVALAFGLGYLLGTRAGRESYDEITRQARLLWDRPEVQSVAGIVSAQAGAVYRRTRRAFGGSPHPDGAAEHSTRLAASGAAPSTNGAGPAPTH